MRTAEICNDERRRSDMRESPLLGLDYLEVSDDQLTLTVYFLGKAPQRIEPENIRIKGGQRIRNIQVVSVDIHHEQDDELDDYMKVVVDRAGDFSTYTLHMVEIKGYDKNHVPQYRRLRGFDNRYAEVQFSFKVNCPSDLDCQTNNACPPPLYEQPEISYLAKDYASFRQLILDRLALHIPGWQEQHIPDIGIALVELLAYVGDYLSYYQDAVATEAYLSTAHQRISVRRHARLVDYAMHEGCNARTWIQIQVSPAQNSTAASSVNISSEDIYFITGNNDALAVNSVMLDNATVQRLPASDYEAFEPLFEGNTQKAPLQFYSAYNEIRFYTWGQQECYLPQGATSASLQDYAHDPNASPDAEEELYLQTEIAEDEQNEETDDQEPAQQTQSAKTQDTSKDMRILQNLKVGDFLLFEEVRGANTGLASDALPSHRHVVRITQLEQVQDHLYGKNVLEVSWAIEDALPFPLCISAIGQAPNCTLLQNISVARGNLLLVDNGFTIFPSPDPAKTATQYSDTWQIQEGSTIATCKGENEPSDVQIIAEPFEPILSQFPVTFSQPLATGLPASQVLTQDARLASPKVSLTSILPDVPSANAQTLWYPQPDLLESEPEDAHFVVEIDNDSYAHLRFGKSGMGRAPVALETFKATYRIGNGLTGNVGVESITHSVFRRNMPPDVTLTPRNPFAAAGGTAPEPIIEVKQFAPHAFRNVLERAITADDYAQLLKNYPGIQRAATSLRWNGSGYDVLIAIDPLGVETLSDSLRTSIVHYLQQFRRIGHDLAVEQARYVPIELEMCIVVQPHYLRGHVKANLLNRLSNRVLSDGTKGYFHPDTLSFGDNIAVSTLVAIAQAVQGVQAVAVKKLQRFREGPNQELAKGVLEIGPLEVAQLDNDPNYPEHGILTLDMKGGR